MANISINKCDKCGLEVRSDQDKKEYDSFAIIRLDYGEYNRFSVVTSQLFLCPHCLVKIGITQQKERSADKLYDIFCEIIAERNIK